MTKPKRRSKINHAIKRRKKNIIDKRKWQQQAQSNDHFELRIG